MPEVDSRRLQDAQLAPDGTSGAVTLLDVGVYVSGCFPDRLPLEASGEARHGIRQRFLADHLRAAIRGVIVENIGH